MMHIHREVYSLIYWKQGPGFLKFCFSAKINVLVDIWVLKRLRHTYLEDSTVSNEQA